MVSMGRRVRYSVEFRERAVTLVSEQRSGYESEWAAIGAVAEKLGCTAESLRKWVRHAEQKLIPEVQAREAERERLKQLERENRELRQANEILRKAALRSTRRCITLSGGVAWRRWVDQVFLIQESRSCGTGGGLVNRSVRLQWRSASHQALFLRFCGTTVV